MRHTFDCHPLRVMNDVQIHMWGELMPKRGQLEYPTKISAKELGLLASEDDNMFVLVLCPYVRMDWRHCPNIEYSQ